MSGCVPIPRTAVIYLARGADDAAAEKFSRFIESYKRWPAGIEHDLFVVFKGFDSLGKLAESKEAFSAITRFFVEVPDLSYDIGAYRDALREIPHEVICCLNTNSEIQSSYWLQKLASNFLRRGVGMVSATGSYESLSMLGRNFPVFPNIHVRSNAFMISREAFLNVTCRVNFVTKKDAWLIESGAFGFTRYVFALGFDALIVGKNGRGYSPAWWASSNIFKVRNQDNLLVQDNVSRGFESMVWSEKVRACRNAWGFNLNNPGSIL